MKRMISMMLILCLIMTGAALFTGCSTEGGEFPVTIGDTTIAKEPKNIVVLNDVFADIVSAIGYDIKMVGRSTECDQDFLYIVPAVGSAASPDTAAIASYEADLVIADNTLDSNAKATIEANGAKVLTLDVPADSDAIKELYINLGTAIGGKTTGSEKGEKGYDNLLHMLGSMNTATSNVVQTVAYLYLDGNNQLCTFVKGTLPFTFFEYNGNTNVFANQEQPAVNLDELRIGSPNYIFYDNDEIPNILSANEKLSKLNALKNKHMMKIPRKSFERYGSSAEEAIFDMLSFIEQDTKAVKETAAATDTKATEAAKKADDKATEAKPTEAVTEEKATEAKPTQAEETQAAEAAAAPEEQDDNVITYTIEDTAE